MKKQLLLFLFSMVSFVSILADDITVTLKYEGQENAYKYVNTYQLINEEPFQKLLPVESDTYEFTYSDDSFVQLYFTSFSDALVEIKGPETGEDTGWMIAEDLGMNLILLPNPDNNGLVFTINVTGGTDDFSTVYIAIGDYLFQEAENGELTGGEKSNVWTGTFIIPGGSPFRFVRKTERPDWIYDDVVIVYIPISPAEPTEVSFSEENDTFTGDVAINQSYYWTLTNENPCEIKMKVDLARGEVIFENMTKNSGIRQLEEKSSQLEIYDLNGVKIENNNLNKGIYIINGKKVAI